MNPEQEARVRLVNLLRARADEQDRGVYVIATVDLRQAANEIETLGRCGDLVRDIAGHGLRCDLHPTVTGTNEVTLYMRMCNYLSEQDASMRARANRALRGESDIEEDDDGDE